MFFDGFLPIYKPRGITSYDVVRQVKRRLRIKRVGHAGTLDPNATGVLLLALGFATRFFYYLDFNKAYSTTARFGYSTDTEDASGSVCEIANEFSVQALNADSVRVCAANFCGNIMQVPSRVSAKKVKGVRAYKMMREGVEFSLDPKPVRIDAISVKDCAPSLQYITKSEIKILCLDFSFYVECSSGTYIRALVRDMGAQLGVPAHMLDLCRQKLIFNNREIALKDCCDLESDFAKFIIPVGDFIKRFFEFVQVGDNCARALLCGKKIPVSQFLEAAHTAHSAEGALHSTHIRHNIGVHKPIAVFDTQDRFISLLCAKDGYMDIKVNNPNNFAYCDSYTDKEMYLG